MDTRSGAGAKTFELCGFYWPRKHAHTHTLTVTHSHAILSSQWLSCGTARAAEAMRSSSSQQHPRSSKVVQGSMDSRGWLQAQDLGR